MIEQLQEQPKRIDSLIKQPHINELVFIGLVVLCFIGDVIGQISDNAIIMYWLLMTPIFFLSSVIIEKSQLAESGNPSQAHVYFGLSFWCSAFLSVLLILLLWHSAAFEAQTVGFIIHVILAHTMFVSGTILGLRFYLIGLFLLLTAGLTITMEGTVALTIMSAIPIVIFGLYFEKNKFLKKLKTKQDKPKERHNFIEIYSVINDRS